MATSRTEEEDTMTSTLAWHTQFVGENSMLFKGDLEIQFDLRDGNKSSKVSHKSAERAHRQFVVVIWCRRC